MTRVVYSPVRAGGAEERRRHLASGTKTSCWLGLRRVSLSIIGNKFSNRFDAERGNEPADGPVGGFLRQYKIAHNASASAFVCCRGVQALSFFQRADE